MPVSIMNRVLLGIFSSAVLFTDFVEHNHENKLAGILCRYGFAKWQSNLHVRICGNDVEQCLDWLLRNGSSMQSDMTLHNEQKMVRSTGPIFFCDYG